MAAPEHDRKRKDRRVPGIRNAVARELTSPPGHTRGAASPPARVVVACSGGPDSTVLFDVLAWLARRRWQGTRLVVAHFRHGLHERDAEMAAHVEQLAARYGMPAVVGHWERRHDDTGHGIEDAARTARYAFLGRVAREHGSAVVATGHTREDQAETILMRLITGTGLAGLAGIPRWRALDETADVCLVRPLLDVSRADVLAYLSHERLSAMTDPTNVDRTRLRNRLRQDILPRLSEIDPRAAEHLSALAGDVAAATPKIERRTRELAEHRFDAETNTFRMPNIGGAPDEAQSEAAMIGALRHVMVERVGLPARQVTRRLVRAVASLATSATGASLDLPGGWRVVRESAAGSLRFVPAHQDIGTGRAAGASNLPRSLSGPGVVEFVTLGRTWQLAVEPTMTAAATLTAIRERPERDIVLAASAAIRWPLVVRSRRAGEQMRPLGSPGRQPLREVMRAVGIPASLRDGWPLLADAAGEVIWIIGRPVLAERVRVRSTAEDALRFRSVAPSPGLGAC